MDLLLEDSACAKQEVMQLHDGIFDLTCNKVTLCWTQRAVTVSVLFGTVSLAFITEVGMELMPIFL
jgi:hypothetical protein